MRFCLNKSPDVELQKNAPQENMFTCTDVGISMLVLSLVVAALMVLPKLVLERVLDPLVMGGQMLV
jgi:hypothetical protein